MRCALSPCPNDTYLFYAWIEGYVGQDLHIDPFFADIQQLNEWALSKTFPLIKISIACFSKIASDYQLLPVGAALGHQCGPKIIAKRPFPLADLPKKRIAIPGKDTTAHALLNLLKTKPKEKLFCFYHEIFKLLEKEVVDCGIIIHESRFTFQQAGYYEILDLGEYWHVQTKSQLPLGGIAVLRNLPDETKEKIVDTLRKSLYYAHQHSNIALPFILKHSQEKVVMTIKNHITTYVTKETENLSQQGIIAIKKMIGNSVPHNWLYGVKPSYDE
jgi:1,4-dihydroxy-6-naphthoate synthase